MKDDISKKDRERFEYIETKLFWEDGVTAGELGNTFGIGRQAAQDVINEYRNRYPGQMEYAPSKKRHEASEGFKAVFIRTGPIAFLDYLRGQALIGHYREESDWTDMEIFDVDRLLRPDLPLIPIRTVLRALRYHKVVMIDYQSKTSEPASKRIRLISPNHIIFADNRYHIRAYCHTREEYRDFNISRMYYAEIVQKEWVSSKEDDEWNTFIELRFIPNPELPSQVQEAIIHSYSDGNSAIRAIKCRKAIAFYIIRKLTALDLRHNIPLWVLIKG